MATKMYIKAAQLVTQHSTQINTKVPCLNVLLSHADFNEINGTMMCYYNLLAEHTRG